MHFKQGPVTLHCVHGGLKQKLHIFMSVGHVKYAIWIFSNINVFGVGASFISARYVKGYVRRLGGLCSEF